MKTETRLTGTNAREKAYMIIRDKIINLELKPGEILNDKILAEQLEMSRTPVHEALIILSTADMVVLKPQTGTFVAPIDVHRMEIEQFIRFSLEKEIITRACRIGLTEDVCWHYEENLRAYEHYSNVSELPDRGKRLLKLDNDFHRLAFQVTGMEDSYEVQFSRMQHIERMRMLSLILMRQNPNIDDHTDIFEAIRAKDRDRAVQRLETHLSRYRTDLKLVQDHYPDYFSLST